MLTRQYGYLWSKAGPPAEPQTEVLEQLGGCLIEQVFTPAQISDLRSAVDSVFDAYPADVRQVDRAAAENAQFRYEMLNRHAVCQQAVSHPRILSVIEPLLGEDCHIIANTAWRNPPKPMDASQPWHVDAGPHIPLPKGTRWPESLPHPVFAIGCHILIEDCSLEDGPTGFVPKSHLSGRPPPGRQRFDLELTFDGQKPRALTGSAGDVLLFVSDVWHRRLPSGSGDRGRYFLQVHYGRRDLQQRLKVTDDAHQLSHEALRRATSEREKSLMGLHAPGFYDG